MRIDSGRPTQMLNYDDFCSNNTQQQRPFSILRVSFPPFFAFFLLLSLFLPIPHSHHHHHHFLLIKQQQPWPNSSNYPSLVPSLKLLPGKNHCNHLYIFIGKLIPLQDTWIYNLWAWVPLVLFGNLQKRHHA